MIPEMRAQNSRLQSRLSAQYTGWKNALITSLKLGIRKKKRPFLLDLPVEILCLIIEVHIPPEEQLSTLFALIRTNKRLHTVLKPLLYQLDAKQSKLTDARSRALDWAIVSYRHLEATALFALEQGASHERGFDFGVVVEAAASFGWLPVVRRIVFGDGGDLCRVSEGRAALSSAAADGHCDILEMLCDHPEIDPNVMEGTRKPPLLKASIKGHVAAVRFLIGRKNVNVNRADDKYQTALIHAVVNNHPDVMEILLSRKDINLNKKDAFWKSALCWATDLGHTKKALRLLEEATIDPNSHSYGCAKDPEASTLEYRQLHINSGWTAGNWVMTPLARTTIRNNITLARRLLAMPDIDPNMPDRAGRTPLYWAVWYRRVEMVDMLLSRRDVIPDLDDWVGRTPLIVAASRGYTEIVKMLLHRPDVNPNITTADAGSPLMHAIALNREKHVRPLLERPDIDLSLVNGAGLTPVEYAQSRGFLEIVRLLQDYRRPTGPRSWFYMPAYSLFEDDGYDREVGVAGPSGGSLRTVTTAPGGTFAMVL
jgi:ankyrin repeat protein